MDWFRWDNTEGFTRAQLAELNAEMWRRGAEKITDPDELKNLKERVQKDYEAK